MDEGSRDLDLEMGSQMGEHCAMVEVRSICLSR